MKFSGLLSFWWEQRQTTNPSFTTVTFSQVAEVPISPLLDVRYELDAFVL